MTNLTDTRSNESTLTGKSLDGYLIHEELGRGGMAIVYRATQPTLNRSVAIKVLRPDFVQFNPQFVSRFQQEAESIARLNHPYILPIYDYGVSEGYHYIAMQYVPEGLTLRSFMSSTSTSLNPTQATEICLHIADALTHAHQNNVIHRDLKPSNVLFHDGRPLLADFGLAILDQDQRYGSSAELIGTPAYMAPEQLQRESADERTDIYALGLIFYQLLTGILPHNAATVEKIATQRTTLPQPPTFLRPELPALLDKIVLKALAVDPAARFVEMLEFSTRLRSLNLHTLNPQALNPQALNPHDAQAMEPLTKPVESPVSDEETLLSPPSLTPFQAPVEPPYFVDRIESRARIHQAVATQEGNHVFGLVGLGGCGKTALATQLVYELREQFPDGVLWAQLGITTPSAALVSFGNSFGQRERVAEEPDLATKATAVRQILANKRILVVLDSVEDSEQLEHLIPTGPQNIALITTRNRKVLTTINAEIIDVDPLASADGLELLEKMLGAERVQAEKETAEAVIDLVGGLPLALDIVAGYLAEAEDLTIAEYKSALQDERLRLDSLADWEDASKDVVASFELSYRKLPSPLQQVFAALSIFAGHTFDADAVSAITKLPLPAAKSALGRMRSLSLLTSPQAEDGALRYGPTQKAAVARYGLHPLLRLFAQTKLTDEVNELNARAAHYFSQFAQKHARDNYGLLAVDQQNIVGALYWAARHQECDTLYQGILGLTEPHVGVVGMLDAFGLWRDARQLLDLALSFLDQEADIDQETGIDQEADPILWAKLTIRAGVFALREGDYETSERYFEHVLAQQENLYRYLTDNDKESMVEIVRDSAYLYASMAQITRRRDQPAASEWLTRGIDALQAAQHNALLAEMGYLHIQFSSMLGRMGQMDEAYDAATKGLALLPATPSPAQIGGLINLANIASFRGSSTQCMAYIEEGIILAETLGEHRRLALLWMNLGAEQEQLGQYRRARNSYQTALQLYQKMGHEDEGYLHSNLGLTYTILGEDELARQHLSAAIQLAGSEEMAELRAYVKTNLARLHLHRQEAHMASAPLSEAHKICDKLTLSRQMVNVLRLQAETALMLDAAADALPLIEQSILMAGEFQDELGAGVSWRIKGKILQALSQLPDAIDAYELSLALIADQDPYERARTQTDFADCLIEKERSLLDSAMTLLHDALETFEKLDTRRELVRVETLLDQLEGS